MIGRLDRHAEDAPLRLIADAVQLARALRSNRGVTAVEYGLILAMVALAIVTAVNAMTGNLTGTFNTIAGFFGNNSH